MSASGHRRVGGRWAALAASSNLVAVGCSVRILDPAPEPSLTNQCSSDADCLGGYCSSGICASASGDIDSVLLEIIPGESTHTGALSSDSVASFWAPVSGLAAGSSTLGILAPDATAFTGKVSSDASNVPRGCSTNGATGKAEVDIGAHIEFTPTPMLDGVPVQGIWSSATAVDVTKTFSFSAQLAPGYYDVYVVPSCDLSPLLITELVVSDPVDPQKPPAVLELPAETNLRGSLIRYDNISFEDWQVSLVDPKRGRRVSTVQKLGTVAPGDNTTNFSINYQPILRTDTTQQSPSTGFDSPILRIMPPADTTAPTVYFDLAAVDLEGDQLIALDVTGLPGPSDLVTVRGTARASVGGQGVRSTLYFFSANLEATQPSGIAANFSRAQSTAADGTFSVRLFAGEYRVIVVPTSDSATETEGGSSDAESWPVDGGATPWAITEQTMTVSSSDTQTHDVEVRPQVTLSGSVRSWTGAGAGDDTSVTATPVLYPDESNVLRDALAQTVLLPASTTTATGQPEAGLFHMTLDPGTFDLVSIPPSSSALPWWVRPGVLVEESRGDTDLSIEATFGLPVPVSGQLVDSSGALVDASLHAYAKAADGTRALEIGRARTDESGRFRLLLPPGFAP